ncbi:hypothetical protein IJT93_06455 [bacterium]|nr:hypothetical protein [bacterium]
MFIKKFFPLALLLCLGLAACEQDRVNPPVDPNSPAAKAEKIAAEKAKTDAENKDVEKTENQQPDAQKPDADKEKEEAAANSPREDEEVAAPEKKADKEPVKLTEKQIKELAKCNNTKQKVTNEVDSGDEWQYTTMSETEYKKFLDTDKNIYWYATNVYNTKDWKIASTPIESSAGINWNSKNDIILLRRNFCTEASYKYSNPKTTMHARYTGKMDVYINNVLVYTDKNKLPNTGDKYTEIKFEKPPIVITDLNTISVVILSKEANNNFDLAIDLQGEQQIVKDTNNDSPASPKADAKAPAAPPKADAKAPAAPPKAAAKAPAKK